LTSFSDRLAQAIQEKKNPVCVGLDPRLASLPTAMREGLVTSDHAAVAHAFEVFCKEVIDVVAPLVPVVKPQAAFFERLGAPGMLALANSVDYATEKGLLVVLDGKRNDIGSTATAYAQAYLGQKPESAWGADGLTVSPYLGDDSLQPFVDVCRERQAGIFVLVKTSNPGGKLFQDLISEEQPLYNHVAKLVESYSEQNIGEHGYGDIGAVVGATYPEQLQSLRKRMPHAFFLIPGYGAQGGGAADTAAGFDDRGLGAIVNSSRGIIFAYENERYQSVSQNRWQEAVHAATLAMIEDLRNSTPAGKL